jgi:hypothetical protein
MALHLFQYPSKWEGGISCSTNDYQVNTPEQWPELLQSYLAICVSSPKTEYIMSDLYHKINCIDHRLQLGLLHGLCLCGGTLARTVEKFLSLGADPNTRCFGHSESVLEGGTALHFAVNLKQFAVAELLLEVVDDPNARTAEGKTALDLIPTDELSSILSSCLRATLVS